MNQEAKCGDFCEFCCRPHFLLLFSYFRISYQNRFRFLLTCLNGIYGARVVFNSFGDQKFSVRTYVRRKETSEQLLTAFRAKKDSHPLEAVVSLTLVAKHGSVIDHIPSELFSLFPNLNIFDAGFPQLGVITANDFADATELTDLLLTGSNMLRELSPGVFVMPKLRELRLDTNAIETIDDFTFANLSSLTTLHLEFNKISVINRNTFSGLFKLIRLTLDANDIHTIENGAFSDLKELRKLGLSENKLKVLNNQILRGPTRLTELSIGGNQIGSISHVYTLSTLETLKLPNSKVNDIDLVKFAKLPNLKILDLSKTGVNLDNYNISSEEFSFEPQVEVLYLESNNITSVESLEVLRIFPNIWRLDLSGNERFKELDEGLLKKQLSTFLPKLDALDV